MPRSDSHDPGAEFPIDYFVFDNCGFDWSIDPFDSNFVTVSIAHIAFVIRMHDDIFVAKLGFGTSGGNFKRTIFQVVEFGRFFFIHHFIIRNSRLAHRIPVHDSVAAINNSGIVHPLEGGADGETAVFIERVGFA